MGIEGRSKLYCENPNFKYTNKDKGDVSINIGDSIQENDVLEVYLKYSDNRFW